MDEEGGDDTAQDEPHGGAHQQGKHGHPYIYHRFWLLLAVPYQTRNVTVVYLSLDKHAGQTRHSWQCLCDAEAVFIWAMVQSTCAVGYGLHISCVSANAVCLLWCD